MKWEEAEKAAYEKWEREHPGVRQSGKNTPPSWFVRNYVESRLNPLIVRLLAEERERIELAIIHAPIIIQLGDVEAIPIEQIRRIIQDPHRE
jgi:hypothetical protein